VNEKQQNRLLQNLPDAWPELCDIAATRDRLAAELAKAVRRRDELQREHDRAERDDLDARSLALIDGKPAPASKAPDITAEQNKNDRALAERARALQLLGQQCEDLVHAKRDEWMTETTKDQTKLRDEYLTALATLKGAAHAFADADARQRWLADFPGVPFRARQPAVGGLIGQNGDPHSFATVFEALAEMVEPPKPRGVMPQPTERPSLYAGN
jgi:hypothetical protein